MQPNHPDVIKGKDHLIGFVLIAYCLSGLLSLFIGLTGGADSPFIKTSILATFIPAITVMIMRYGFRSPVAGPGMGKFPVRWVVPALFAMPLVIHSVCLPLIFFLNGHQLPWESWLISRDGVYHTPASRDWGTLSRTGLIFRILFNAFAGLAVVFFLVFFEEIGWRAWMLPRLLKRFHLRKAVLVGAIIWSLWHIPFMFSGILVVKDVPTWFVVLLHPLGIIGAGLVLNWFWIKTQSIWIVTLAHAGLNNWGQFAFKFMQDTGNSSDPVWLFAAVNGSLLLLGIATLFSLGNRNHMSAEVSRNPH